MTGPELAAARVIGAVIVLALLAVAVSVIAGVTP